MGWGDGLAVSILKPIPYHPMKIPRHHPARPVFAIVALAAAAIFMSSCRTTAGLGRDIQHVGSKIGHAAERAM